MKISRKIEVQIDAEQEQIGKSLLQKTRFFLTRELGEKDFSFLIHPEPHTILLSEEGANRYLFMGEEEPRIAGMKMKVDPSIPRDHIRISGERGINCEVFKSRCQI